MGSPSTTNILRPCYTLSSQDDLCYFLGISPPFNQCVVFNRKQTRCSRQVNKDKTDRVLELLATLCSTLIPSTEAEHLLRTLSTHVVCGITGWHQWHSGRVYRRWCDDLWAQYLSAHNLSKEICGERAPEMGDWELMIDMIQTQLDDTDRGGQRDEDLDSAVDVTSPDRILRNKARTSLTATKNEGDELTDGYFPEKKASSDNNGSDKSMIVQGLELLADPFSRGDLASDGSPPEINALTRGIAGLHLPPEPPTPLQAPACKGETSDNNSTVPNPALPTSVTPSTFKPGLKKMATFPLDFANHPEIRPVPALVYPIHLPPSLVRYSTTDSGTLLNKFLKTLVNYRGLGNSGYIYISRRADLPSFVKIGSVQDSRKSPVESRLKRLTMDCGVNHEEVYQTGLIQCKAILKMETLVHTVLEEYRYEMESKCAKCGKQHREFFKLPRKETTAEKLIAAVASFMKIMPYEENPKKGNIQLNGWWAERIKIASEKAGKGYCVRDWVETDLPKLIEMYRGYKELESKKPLRKRQ